MLTRRLLGAALVIFASVATVFALRRGSNQGAFAPAPDFRQKGPVGRLTVVEFSDFECPACRAAEPSIAQFLQTYPDAHFVFKDFPLERMHPWARPAATIAECAGRQGKFWLVHDAFYAHQEQWAQSSTPEADLTKLAVSQGVDPAALQACLQDPGIKRSIDADIQEGKDRWVYSTPTFFVNGKRFIGGHQLAALAPIWIDKHVKQP